MQQAVYSYGSRAAVYCAVTTKYTVGEGDII
ncbi:hypothetical protein IMSAG192_00219 [Muribaculaceae bacterium]|nr:hypothetical protein IMSAG192_00219 [Muribaculaceae bacterium]